MIELVFYRSFIYFLSDPVQDQSPTPTGQAAKNNAKQNHWPRISLVRLPVTANQGADWQPLDVKFPGPGGPSIDLESACRIPGGKGFLFAESGQGGETGGRIFFTSYHDSTLTLDFYVQWPVPVENVEATEVCQVGGHLVFLYDERAEDAPATKLRWAELALDPLSFGEFKEVDVQGVYPVGKNSRTIVAPAVDSDGSIYSVSSYDPASDDGQFRSVI